MTEEIRPAVAPVSDHGSLTGLSDDDHGAVYSLLAHAHTGSSAKASASADLTATTTTAADVTGATLSLDAGTYIVIGNFDVSIKSDTDRLFEGVLDVGGTDENDLAVLQGVGLDTDDRVQVLQVWRVVLGSTTTVKLQARHSGGAAGDFAVNAANTTLTAAVAGSAGAPAAASGARVYNSADIALGNGTLTLMTFDTERWDDAAYHSTVTNTSRLTVPDAGRYMLGFHVNVTASGGTTGYILLREGGATIIAVQNYDIAAGGRYASITSVWDCTGGTEYFEAMTVINTTSKNAVAVAAYSPEFWIERLGDT